MTEIEIEHIHAEIGKLIAESTKLNAESTKFNMEARKLGTEHDKLEREHAFYPAVLLVSAFGAGAAIITAFYHLVH